MAGNNINWGKKGSMIGLAFVFFVLFVILCIWLYQKNMEFLPQG